MKKIGIMGGTFNPVHMGHLILAETAYEEYGLDSIWFMPSKKPPHKIANTIISDHYRRDMTALAIENNEHFELSSIELEREGDTFTIDTMLELKKRYPTYEFYFIIGGDSLFQFETWKDTDKLVRLTQIIAASRYHIDEKEIRAQMEYLNRTYSCNIKGLSMPAVDISAKMIREFCKSGKSIRYFTPDKVISYMEEYELYQ